MRCEQNTCTPPSTTVITSLSPLTDTSESLFHEASESFVAHLTVVHAEPTASGLLEVVR